MRIPTIFTGDFGLINFSSARGNTTLESAVTTTKDLRWEIQALGIRIAKAATAEEASQRKNNKAKSRASHQKEIREIVQDIRNLIARIEEAVPFLSLAITTCGASLSTTLPPTISPSRLLQASTFLTAADTRYSMDPKIPVQVGPTFTLSLYMLFTGHYRRNEKKELIARESTFKEVIHKARVKLMRLPLQSTHISNGSQSILQSIEAGDEQTPTLTGERKQNEYSYRLEIIEDLEDDRVHEFEDGGPQPGPYGDVPLAGIREFLPIYQVSRIFYADTGKVLGIGDPEEMHSPVLLLKRDINAKEPRQMMEESEKSIELYEDSEEQEDPRDQETLEEQEITEKQGMSESGDDSQDDVDAQIRKESSAATPAESVHEVQSPVDQRWRLPADLDTEWLAFEVYTEQEDSSSEDEQDVSDDSAYMSHRPRSSGEAQSETSLIDGLENLHLNQQSAVVPVPSQNVRSSPPVTNQAAPNHNAIGPVRTALSLLEMLIRLTALQQFQQASHLAIHDEFLTFFLCESSTTGAGADAELRKRTRREAVNKMGFDPYDESPIKPRGEDYQYQIQGQEQYDGYSRGNTPYEERNHRNGYPSPRPGWMRERNSTPEPWLLRSREHSSASQRSSPPPNNPPSSPPPAPTSPYRPQRKSTRPLNRVQQGSIKGSPLGRGMSVETDSTLGTSPGSPALAERGGNE